MSGNDTQGPSQEIGRHLLLYDGTCGLCHGVVRRVLPLDRRGVFHVASLQSAAGLQLLARVGGHPGRSDTFVVITNYQSHAGEPLTKGAAALFVLTALGWPWKAAALFGLLPAAALDAAYDLVARHRYRLFGQRDRCLVPRPEYQRRFVDGAADTSRQEVR